MFTIALAIAAGLATGVLVRPTCARPKLREMRAELAATRWLAEHDSLTDLLNRAGAQRHHELRTAEGKAHAAVLIDLDGFKAVNDTWGHQVGDAQLIAVAERLAAACAPIGGVACRLAGDEFLLLLPETDPHVLVKRVTAILARLSEPIRVPTEDAITLIIKPSASAGIAVPEPDSTWSSMLRNADIALYHAKALTGQVVLYTRGMRQPLLPNPHGGPRLRGQAQQGQARHGQAQHGQTQGQDRGREGDRESKRDNGYPSGRPQAPWTSRTGVQIP